MQYKIDPEVLAYYSLKLFLQPIIENAITHGVKPMVNRKKGEILIEAVLREKTILFTVVDNGIGIEEEKLTDIMALENHDGTKNFGLRNVMRRINLYFGGEFGVSIKSEPRHGTEVTILIPALDGAELNERLQSTDLQWGI